MPHLRRYAVFGGVYSNHLALEAVLKDAARRGAEAVYCLGDLGGFGPHPDRVFPILLDHGVHVLQGNYDYAIGHGLPDCGCGYTDPRDNHYARLSYNYTRARTSERWWPYLRSLPPLIRTEWAGQRVLMAHGSPRRVNEFLWESTSPDAFLRRLLRDHQADVLLVSHSGLPWQRRLPGEQGGLVVNVGAIGRPANDGRTEVWYALLTVDTEVRAELVPVAYDEERLAHEMRQEGLPQEFVETILTGWWTTCLEILPPRERSRGRF
ncbi:MAG: metallophosphoesterase family protein [Myxococcales bacterium]|nr:metallophosphatase family protein [Myxococcota bacterium]MDW8280674.1 metallophosphoesterase family protein [Myxococcales bacterium]